MPSNHKTYCYNCGKSPANEDISVLVDYGYNKTKIYARRLHCSKCLKEQHAGNNLFLLIALSVSLLVMAGWLVSQ